MWPQFRSPLAWDFFAILTYGTVSFLFWYQGLVPDLAVLRDRAESKWAKLFFGFLSMGWIGASRDWSRYEKAYIILAGLATPLVVSVHSIVSLDFTIAILPGWHSTIFPPYFVAGAIFSGFAMVLMLAIPLRKVFQLQNLITNKHLERAALLMLISGLFVDYGYLMETFTVWYNGDVFERGVLSNRATGAYAPLYWLLLFCNVVVPQVLWIKRIRTNVLSLFIIATIINIGMWVERYVIIVTSLHRSFLPSSWGMYHGTFWDWMTFLGSFGLFFVLFLLFIRLLPLISIFEVSEATHELSEQDKAART